MPEFILNTEGNTAKFDALDAMTQAAIGCIFFNNQCPASVAIAFTDQGAESSYICAWPRTDDPGFTKRDWLHPDIQDAVREGQSDGEIPADAGVSDLSDVTIDAVALFVADWYAANKTLADRAIAIMGAESVGNDIIFTYTGCGVGFWDRADLDADDLGEKLSEATGRGEIYAYYDAARDCVEIDIM